MAYPTYIRDKARQMRVERAMTLDEIAERLALPKTTVWYWIKDLPLGRPRANPIANFGQSRGNEAMQRKYRVLREAATHEGRETFESLCEVPTFRDFVCLYLAEGYKRNRNVVSLANSDPAVIQLCTLWVRRLTVNKVTFAVQFHADQELLGLQRFWGSVVEAGPEQIRLQRKSNSNQLAGRTWRSVHGVLAVTSNDTLFRARLEGWMERLRGSWA